MSKKENYKNYVYQFCGGRYGGKFFNYHELEVRGMIEKYSPNHSFERAQGWVVPREELDDQPVVNGYLGPMYDGIRYIVDGQMKYSFECSDEEQAVSPTVCVIRYDTQEVYDMLSR